MKKWTYVPALSIISGETLIFYDKIFPGSFILIVTLLAIILLIIFGNLPLDTRNILQSLTLLPIAQIINLSIPQFSFFKDVRILTYGIMFIPIYYIIKSRNQSYKESKTILSILLYSPLSLKRVYIDTSMIISITSIVAMIGIPYVISSKVTNVIGEYVSILLIFILSISLLLSDTKHWNEYNSNSINILSVPLLLTFIAIVIHKIIIIS